MKIDGIAGDKSSSSWEVYENYRRTIGQGQDSSASKSLAAGGTQESAATKRVANAQGCETCKGRKYQDESNDPGVSFKNAASVAPNQAFSMVRGHEMEHVTREQTKAKDEDRQVVSQSVVYHNGICSECGKVYIAGGTTQTTTRSNPQSARQEPEESGLDVYA